MGIGDWGLGMGIGDWAQSPVPNPQKCFYLIINYKNKKKQINIYIILDINIKIRILI
jgi:hypothetical protein